MQPLLDPSHNPRAHLKLPLCLLRATSEAAPLAMPLLHLPSGQIPCCGPLSLHVTQLLLQALDLCLQVFLPALSSLQFVTQGSHQLILIDQSSLHLWLV